MIQLIKQIITDLGIQFRYGNPAQINEYLQHVDYSATAGGVAAYCYLLTDTEYTNGKEGGNVAVFFSTLIDFDFDGQQALNATDICKAKAKEFLQKVAESNLIRYEDARFQYGYDDFAENVAWCAVRAYFEDMVPDCVPWKQLKSLIPVIQSGGLGSTPEYNPDLKILAFHVFTNSDTPFIPIVSVNNVVTEPVHMGGDFLDSTYFGDISQQYPEYWGHIFYTVFVHVEELPVTISAKVGDVETNSLLVEQ